MFFQKDPILIDFMNIEKNKILYEKYLSEPTLENKKALNKKFQKHFFIIRCVSYFIKVIHFESKHFDRKKRNENKTYLFLLDTDEQNTTNKINPFVEDTYFEQQLEELIINPIMFQAIKKLNKREKRILYHIYLENQKEVDVAQLLGVTPQAINKSKKNILKKIKKEMNQTA